MKSHQRCKPLFHINDSRWLERSNWSLILHCSKSSTRKNWLATYNTSKTKLVKWHHSSTDHKSSVIANCCTPQEALSFGRLLKLKFNPRPKVKLLYRIYVSRCKNWEDFFFNTSTSTSLFLTLNIFTRVRLDQKCSIVTIPGLKLTNVLLPVLWCPLSKDKTVQTYHHFHGKLLYELHFLDSNIYSKYPHGWHSQNQILSLES